MHKHKTHAHKHTTNTHIHTHKCVHRFTYTFRAELRSWVGNTNISNTITVNKVK